MNILLSRRNVLGTLLGLAILFTWIIPIDDMATEQIDAGLKRALISFGTARAFNAVISAVQGTEIAATPAGIGMTFSLGQVLKPINEVIEQFAQVMLAASIAFGIERILISVGAHWMIRLAITVLAGYCAYATYKQQFLHPILIKTLGLLFMIRFAMPLAIIGSDMLFQQFMAEDYNKSQQRIEDASGQVSVFQQQVTGEKNIWERLAGKSEEKELSTSKEKVEEELSDGNNEPVAESKGLWAKLKEKAIDANSKIRKVKEADGEEIAAADKPKHQAGEEKGIFSRIKGWISNFDIQKKLADLKLAAESAVEHAVKLMVIFLLQTLVLPLLLIWILWGIIKGTTTPPTHLLQSVKIG